MPMGGTIVRVAGLGHHVERAASARGTTNSRQDQIRSRFTAVHPPASTLPPINSSEVTREAPEPMVGARGRGRSVSVLEAFEAPAESLGRDAMTRWNGLTGGRDISMLAQVT